MEGIMDGRTKMRLKEGTKIKLYREICQIWLQIVFCRFFFFCGNISGVYRLFAVFCRLFVGYLLSSSYGTASNPYQGLLLQFLLHYRVKKDSCRDTLTHLWWFLVISIFHNSRQEDSIWKDTRENIIHKELFHENEGCQRNAVQRNLIFAKDNYSRRKLEESKGNSGR